jgi:hypothetical protein
MLWSVRRAGVGLLGLVLALALTTACGATPDAANPPPTPAEPTVSDVSDPRQYVRDALMVADNSFGGRAEYVLRDTEALDEAIDKAMRLKRRKWDGELPHDRSELDAFIDSAARTWRVAQLDTEERRAQIAKQVQEYFENPDIERDGDTVHVDLGILPGELKKRTRTGWGILRSEYANNSEAKPEVLQRAFRQAVEAHPDAPNVQVRVLVPNGKSLMQSRYRYDAGEDRLFVDTYRAKVMVSREPIGGVQAIIDGQAELRIDKLVWNQSLPKWSPDWFDPWVEIK